MACVNAARADLARLTAAIAAKPALEITVDLVGREIRFDGRKIPLTMRDSARDALVHGRWDPIGELLEGATAVAATASRLPYLAAPQK